MFAFLFGVVVGILLAAAFPGVVRVAEPAAEGLSNMLQSLFRQMRNNSSSDRSPSNQDREP